MYFRNAIVATTAIAMAACTGSSNPQAPSPSSGSVVRIVVAGSPPAVGASTQFTAMAVRADNSNEVVTSQATWLSSNPSIASVTSNGIGEVIVTAGGAKFTFRSVDLYSSTTPIPYVITGIANSATVFVLQNTQGNTFGNFASIMNSQPAALIDALVIRLSNSSAPCCQNPMGLDNISVSF